MHDDRVRPIRPRPLDALADRGQPAAQDRRSHSVLVRYPNWLPAATTATHVSRAKLPVLPAALSQSGLLRVCRDSCCV
jgi:hypothetical protein